MEAEVRAILVGWTDLSVEDKGAFWVIAGRDPYGRAHSGGRDDAISLADDLRAIAEREEAARAAVQNYLLNGPQEHIERIPDVPLPPIEPAPEVAPAADPAPEPAPVDPLAEQPVEQPAEQPPEPQPANASPPAAEPASAPPSDQPLPASDGGAALSYPAYAGTMLQEDRVNFLRGQIAVRVTHLEIDRLQARFDANARARQAQGFSDWHNAQALGLELTPEQQSAYAEWQAADAWVRATKDHADALRTAAVTVGLDMLEAMQTSIEEGWP